MFVRAVIMLIALTIAAFGIPHSALASGVDYICGDHYSIVIEPKDRTYTSFDGNTAEQRDDLAAPHSITSSAATSKPGGTVRLRPGASRCQGWAGRLQW
jgi:hypothetical protein